METSRLRSLLDRLHKGTGTIAVLTGAGISAESGIPTFRGPEGYWTVGSTEYRPEQMATHFMFRQDPWEVWSWYLYRRAVCLRAEPNVGHKSIVTMESTLADRMRLITQNVDGLHLRTGNTQERTFQIHGNLHFMRCAHSCSTEIFPIPPSVGLKKRNESVTDEEKSLLVCPRCGSLARPHVLWFDETYNEQHFRADSSLRWAHQADLLLVVGTSGATNLPMQMGEIFSRRPEAIFLDVNPHPNPFREMAEAHPNGLALKGTACEILPVIAELLVTRP